MTSAVRPPNASRVTMLMQSNLLLENIRSNSVDMLKVQNQLSTGLKLSRPSDSPAEATTVMHLDSLLERQSQYLANLDYAEDFMAGTDDALTQAVDLATEAYNLALSSIGTTGSPETNLIALQGIIDQLVNVSNYTSRGAYIFAGQNVTEAPFEAYRGGVLYTGDLTEMETRVSTDNLLDFSVDGNDTFGALSSEVEGIVDLNPDIDADTLLSSLNGTLGRGIRLGSIVISDGTNTDIVDLSNCVTVGDVIDTINNNVPATTAALGADGCSLQVSSALGGASLTIKEVGTGFTARDLGIYESVGSGADISGQDVDARLTPHTLVTALAGGAGIDTISGLDISNSLLPDADPIDLSAAVTVGDILNAINHSDLCVRAEINSDGTGINVFNQLSGSEMSIGENGGTTAADLGIRSMVGSTKLTDLNDGTGVGVLNDDGVEGVIRITARDTTTYDIALGTAETVQDVIDLINAATGAHITADLADNGNGIELIDNGGGGGDLSVTTISSNNYFVAAQLGLDKSVSSNTLTGDDVNTATPQGLFSHLIALRDAMESQDDAAIEQAANAVDADRENLSNYHGQVGSMMQNVTQRKTHMEDNVLATETLRSDIRDIDFTEAITRYQNLYTALQANLQVGGELSNMTLLDFLR